MYVVAGHDGRAAAHSVCFDNPPPPLLDPLLLRAVSQAAGGYDASPTTLGLLLDAGADIESADWDGVTACMNAARSDNLPRLEFLVEKGCDIYATVQSGDDKGLDAVALAEQEWLNKQNEAAKYGEPKCAQPNTLAITTTNPNHLVSVLLTHLL